MRTGFASFVLAVMLAAAAGCTQAGPSEEPAATTPPVRAMDPLRARSEIASNFPLEVPVPDGRIVRGKGQGPDAWDYEVVVDSAPGSLADWYRQAYAGRNWQNVRDAQTGGADAGAKYTLAFRKGTAESMVVVAPDGEGARASAILGVGAPVLQTQ